MTKNHQKKSVLAMLIRLTLVFVLAQIGLIYLNSDIILQNNPVQDFLKTQALASHAVVWAWGKFILAQGLLYTSFIMLLWWLTRATALFLRLSWRTTHLLALVTFCFAIIFLFFANQYYFPNSIFAFLPHLLGANFAPYLTNYTLHTIVFISGAMLAIIALMACFGSLIWVFKNPISIVTLLLGIIFFSGYTFYYKPQPSKPTAHATIKSERPNIILIGIDSLTPSSLSYFGAKKENLPTVDNFLKQSTVFTHSLTPLARTSPAWISILTGDYPKKTNARYNLTNPKQLTIPESLPKLLQHAGYYTVYSTDDRGFNQIDKQFGFNRVIGPKMGLNDFLFSQLNDFPLSNLIMNLPIAQKLFPYNYSNRATTFTYYPKTYSENLTKQIAQRPNNKPLFLAVHFALPHWPFYYATLLKDKNKQNIQTEDLYTQTLSATDKQVNALLTTLKKQGLLNNTFVILLSDHGTSFGKKSDRITQKENFVPVGEKPPFRFYTPNLAHGHGTDVLTLPQYHTVLAMRYFGGQKQFIGSKNTVVSLIDIAPTILNFLNLKSPYKMQGISLLSLVNTSNDTLQPRPIFIETGFTLPGILSATPKAEVVLKEGISYYQVIPENGHMIINPIYAPMIIKGKNRAIISPPWMLAFYPNQNQAGTLVLINMITKEWTTNLTSKFAQQSPLRALATQLKRFYGNEINMPNLPTSNTISTNIP